MSDYSIEIINNQAKLERLISQFDLVSTVALDIETVEWWNRSRERIALIQLAFRGERGVKVAVVDTLAELDLKALNGFLQSNSITKIIHNAAFDAGKLFKHYKFKVSPIFDTMVAARRNREKKYSLQAQAAIHLNIHLDKSAQKSDWSRRPLDLRQIDYAARDAFATLLLYEDQRKRSLHGDYLPAPLFDSTQMSLPLDNLPAAGDISELGQELLAERQSRQPTSDLTMHARALLGIIAELPLRYGPDQLAVSVGAEQRVGVAGWIVDRTLGRETDFDEDSARLAIADLMERKLIRLTETRRLEATAEGARLWQKIKDA